MNPSASVLSLTPSLPIAHTVRSPLSSAAGLTAGAWFADAPGPVDPPPPWLVPELGAAAGVVGHLGSPPGSVCPSPVGTGGRRRVPDRGWSGRHRPCPLRGC